MASDKLQLGLRRHQGRQLLDRFLTDLSDRLHRPKESFRLLTLEQTDALIESLARERQSHMDGTKAAFRLIVPSTEVQTVQAVIATLKGEVLDQRMYLIRALSEYCGAVEVTEREVLENLFGLIELDQEEAKAVAPDVSYGIVLDYYSQRTPESQTEIVYDLSVWGDRWLAALSGQSS